jgi:hypothetical protein
MVAAKIELAASHSLDSHVPQVCHSCCRPWTLILSHVSDHSHDAACATSEAAAAVLIAAFYNIEFGCYFFVI